MGRLGKTAAVHMYSQSGTVRVKAEDQLCSQYCQLQKGQNNRDACGSSAASFRLVIRTLSVRTMKLQDADIFVEVGSSPGVV